MSIPTVITQTHVAAADNSPNADTDLPVSRLPKVNQQTLNSWKAALNNNFKARAENSPVNVEHEQYLSNTNFANLENQQEQVLTSVDLQSDNIESEVTIQQLRNQYWQPKENIFLQKNNTQAPSNTHPDALVGSQSLIKSVDKTLVPKHDLPNKNTSDTVNLETESGIDFKIKDMNDDLRTQFFLDTDSQDTGANLNPLIAQNPELVKTSETSETASTVNDIELQTLLEKFCSSLYLGPQSGPNSLNNVVLDVSRSLPGTLIEISQQGAFLNIKIISSDENTLRTMRRDKDKLSDGISASTNLVVRVESVFRDQSNDSNV